MNSQIETKFKKERRLIIFSLIGFFILIVLIFLLIFLISIFNRSNSNNNLAQNIVENEIETDVIKPTYRFIVVNKRGDLELRTLESEIITLSIEKISWTKPKWSFDYSQIALIGTSKGIDDLYFYDIAEKKMTKITNYSNTSGPITSLEWGKQSDLYFTQGNSGERWLHKVDTKSLANGIQKIFPTEGIIIDEKVRQNSLVLRDEIEFQIVNFDGKIIENYTRNVVGINNETIKLERIFRDNLNIIFYGSDENFYKSIDNKNFLKLNIEKFSPICSINNLIYGYINNENSTEIFSISISDDNYTKSVLGSYNYIENGKDINSFSAECLGDRIRLNFGEEDNVIFFNKEFLSPEWIKNTIIIISK